MRIIVVLVLVACGKRTPESTPPLVAAPADVDSEVAAPPVPPSYPHVGYMERIRRQVNYWWQQNLDDLPSSVRLSRSSYTTEIEVILDGNGVLEHIEVTEFSGSPELDDAVIRAFRRASPFDHPPDGLVQKDGRVYLPSFDFTVQLERQRTKYFQGQGKLFPPADLEPE
jgi:TonB family protein